MKKNQKQPKDLNEAVDGSIQVDKNVSRIGIAYNEYGDIEIFVHPKDDEESDHYEEYKWDFKKHIRN